MEGQESRITPTDIDHDIKEPDDERVKKVVVTVDNKPHSARPGTYVVSEFKRLVKVRPDYELEEIINGHPPSLVLLASRDARRPDQSYPGTGWAPRARRHTTLHALEPGRVGRRDSTAGSGARRQKFWRHIGDGRCVGRKTQWIEQLNWR